MSKGIVDWDVEVGAWLRNIPYIWNSFGDKWSDCERIYIVPSSVGLSYSDVKSGYFDLPMKNTDCSSFVRQYFMASLFAYGLNIKKIRVNGYPVYFPQKYISGETFLTSENLYDYIGVKPPTEKDVEEWEDILLVKFTDPRPSPVIIEVDIPKITIESTPEKGYPTILSGKDSREFHLMAWYLQHVGKYPGVCMPIIKSGFTDIIDIMSVYSLQIYIKKIDFSDIQIGKPYQKKEFPKITQMCMRSNKIKSILIPMSWQYHWHKDKSRKSSHANFILIDKLISNKDGRANVYLFDPWGKTEHSKTKDILPDIMNWLNIGEKDGYKWNYHISTDWCPVVSFQKLETKIGGGDAIRIGDYEGFCSVWSMWVLEMIIRNPGKPYETIIRSALSSLSKYSPDFRRFIRKYARTIEEYSDEIRKRLSIEFKTPPRDAPADVRKGPLTEEDKHRITQYIDPIYKSQLEELERKD